MRYYRLCGCDGFLCIPWGYRWVLNKSRYCHYNVYRVGDLPPPSFDGLSEAVAIISMRYSTKTIRKCRHLSFREYTETLGVQHSAQPSVVYWGYISYKSLKETCAELSGWWGESGALRGLSEIAKPTLYSVKLSWPRYQLELYTTSEDVFS